MNQLDTAWLAGLIEGEGTIIFTGKQSVVLNVYMTDEDTVLKCQQVSGVGTVRGPYQDRKRPHCKPCWKWSVSRSQHVVTVLEAIRPWMGQRRTNRIDEALTRLVNIRGRATRLCPRGHYSWHSSGLKGGRYCRDCANDAQRLRRSANA